VLVLEVVLLLDKEALKMMEQHAIEKGALGMTGPVDS
jgi:hypothetical protein